MQMIERDRCIINGRHDLEDLYTFKEFPALMGVTDAPFEKDLKADMIWSISKSSGMIQLRKLLPLDILYKDGHNSGAIGGIWAEHHKQFAEFIMKESPKKVFEIGGGHGILARECNKLGDVEWTILEPASHIASMDTASPMTDKIIAGTIGGGVDKLIDTRSRIRYIKGFFDDNYKFEMDYDAIVHSQLFEHIYDPDSFIKTIAGFMDGQKTLYFSVPNLFEWLKQKYTNTLNFEHTYLLREEYIEYMLGNYGIIVERKEYFNAIHSIFYSCKKGSSHRIRKIELDPNLYKENKALFLAYVDYYKKIVSELNAKIESCSRPVYIFGAHIFTQYLLAFGLNSQNILAIVDNDKAKHHKRLYGTNLIVYPSKILANPALILRAGIYNEEIKNDIVENINPNTEFWM